MRKIVSEDEVVSGSARGTEGRGGMPKVGVYIPNYKGVNQVLYRAGGNGAVAFGDALAATSVKAMQAQREVYNDIETSGNMSVVDDQHRVACEEYLKTNETGQGFMEFAMSKYQELSDAAVENASNADVQNNLRILFEHRKRDIANSSFQKEKEIYTGYALNDIGVKSNATLNEIINNPDEIHSLSLKYETQIGGMTGIVSAVEFEKYKTERIHDLATAYGMGLIRKDPYNAQNLLKGEYFTKQLPTDRYEQLLNRARAEVEHREAKEKQREALAKEAFNKNEQKAVSELLLGFAADTKWSADVEDAYQSGQISETTRNNMLRKYLEIEGQRKKKIDTDMELSECVKNGTPALLISTEDKNKHFMESVKGMNDIRSGSGEPPMSLTETVEYAKNNAIVYDSNISPLKNACVTSIVNGKDAKTIMDACVAIKDNEKVPAIKGIDNDVVFFSSIAVDHYKATNNLNDVLELRDKFFAPSDEKTRLYREEQWKNEEYGKADKKDDALCAFLKRNGFATEEHWGIFGGDKIPVTIKDDFKAQAHDILKRVYMKTGSVSIAESVASNILNSHFGVSDINGDDEKMYNPPTEANTKLSAVARANFVAERGQDLMESIEKAGDKYKGHIHVKRVPQEDKKGNITGSHNFIKDDKNIQPSDFYKKDLVKDKSRKIQAFIGGKWEVRSLRIEATPINDSTYCYYILLDESNALSKEYLIDPETGKRALIDFRGIERMK